MSELRGLGVVQDEMQKTGGRLAAVSVDTPEQARGTVERHKLRYTLLSDPDARLIREFHVLHPGGGERGQDTAIPSIFLIDRDGQIVWRRIAQRVQDRPDPQTLIREIREHFSR